MFFPSTHEDTEAPEGSFTEGESSVSDQGKRWPQAKLTLLPTQLQPSSPQSK